MYLVCLGLVAGFWVVIVVWFGCLLLILFCGFYCWYLLIVWGGICFNSVVNAVLFFVKCLICLVCFFIWVGVFDCLVTGLFVIVFRFGCLMFVSCLLFGWFGFSVDLELCLNTWCFVHCLVLLV